MDRRTDPEPPPADTAPAGTARHWLLFVHQLPSHPSNLRVRTWRRLQQIGAIPVKQAVYVLPDTANAREDFAWLTTEVKAAGGEAAVFAGDSVDAWTDDELIEGFRRARQEDYAALAADLERASKRLTPLRRKAGASPRRDDVRGARDSRAAADGRLLDTFRERLMTIERIDFFAAAGRDRVTTLFADFDTRVSGDAKRTPGTAPARDRTAYQRRLWVTRPRPGVDRMSSAWLVRRFIDPRARFGFAADRDAVPHHAVPFDMSGVEFSHQGDGCTFETLCSAFGLSGPALARIAAIVHDLDLKEHRFAAPETATVGTLIDGLRLACSDDDTLLAQGMALFESLFLSFDQAARAAAPPAARRTAPARNATKRAVRKQRRGPS